MNYYNIPVFIVHYGCPHQCVFCNQKKITGLETNIKVNEIKEIIDTYLKTLPKDSYKQVAFFGGSFTGISKKLQKKYLDVVKPYIESKKIDGIRLSTRPDYIDEEILDFLKVNNVNTIELGIQSFDKEVLEKSERGYMPDQIYKASKLIKSKNFELGIQIMPGLPDSSKESDFYGVKEIIKIAPDMVRIYPTLVISDTELETWYEEGTYTPLELEESVNRVIPMIALLELNDIKIIRVGLQPSDDLRADGVIKAGPFHPAYKELAETEIYYRFFKEKLENFNSLEVKLNEKNISKAIGMKKKNKVRLGSKLDIIKDNKININDISINGEILTRENMLKNILKNSEECG